MSDVDVCGDGVGVLVSKFIWLYSWNGFKGAKLVSPPTETTVVCFGAAGSCVVTGRDVWQRRQSKIAPMTTTSSTTTPTEMPTVSATQKLSQAAVSCSAGTAHNIHSEHTDTVNNQKKTTCHIITEIKLRSRGEQTCQLSFKSELIQA